MKRWKASTMFLLAFACCFVVVGRIAAKDCETVVKPNSEIMECVELPVSGELSGKASAHDGVIDFYITSPSEDVLVCSNRTTSVAFDFNATEGGTYTIHLVNRWMPNNVTVSLNYGKSVVFVLQAETQTVSSVAISSTGTIAYPAKPFDWLDFLRTLWAFTMPLIPLLPAIGKLISLAYWKAKHGKSKTPVIIWPPLTHTIPFGCCFSTNASLCKKAFWL